MKLISLEQLLALHVLAVGAGGGDSSLRDLGRLEAAVAAQTQFVFGEELYPTIYEKAAAMCRGIIGDHPFVDGNKRTAMLATITLLEINGYKFRAKQDEIEDFAVLVATKKPDIGVIAEWFKEHSEER